MDRKEAVALLKELGSEQLVQPSFVLVEQMKPDKFQLQIRGDFDFRQIEILLRNRGLSFEDNNGYLIISKP